MYRPKPRLPADTLDVACRLMSQPVISLDAIPCTVCDYDLRATPTGEPCPECGTRPGQLRPRRVPPKLAHRLWRHVRTPPILIGWLLFIGLPRAGPTGVDRPHDLFEAMAFIHAMFGIILLVRLIPTWRRTTRYRRHGIKRPPGWAIVRTQVIVLLLVFSTVPVTMLFRSGSLYGYFIVNAMLIAIATIIAHAAVLVRVLETLDRLRQPDRIGRRMVAITSIISLTIVYTGTAVFHRVHS